jgi:serine/threonine-protein kinase
VAFRSACGDNGCVATQSSIGNDNKPVAGEPARIFDFIDGNWRWAGDVEGTCNEGGSDATLAAQYFKSMSLSPQPDGTLTGTLVTLGGVDPCQVANHAPVRVTRVGDVDPGVLLPDPSSLKAPVASPAGALHGAYDYHYTDRKFVTELPITRARVSTYCLRTGTRCLTLLLLLTNQGRPDKFQVLTYADQHWKQTTGGGDAPCPPPGGTATKSVVTDFALPDPPTDPITKLPGVETTTWVGPCPAERGNDILLSRTGD